MSRWKTIKLVDKISGEIIMFAGVMLIVFVWAVYTGWVVNNNTLLREENRILMDKNAKLQIENWKLGTAVGLCPPAIKSVYVTKE